MRVMHVDAGVRAHELPVVSSLQESRRPTLVSNSRPIALIGLPVTIGIGKEIGMAVYIDDGRASHLTGILRYQRKQASSVCNDVVMNALGKISASIMANPRNSDFTGIAALVTA